MTILAVDVGAGTQDIVLYDEKIPLEASTKMVLPSPTILVARRINQARSHGKDIFLSGPTMGGGACTAALGRHLAAGLHVYATTSAAATVNDNLERVIEMGIIIQEEPPQSAEIIETGDINIPALRKAFNLFDLDLPREIAVAVQDHGYAPHKSNRLARFEHFASAIKAGGCIEAFAYNKPPDVMTRMQAVSSYLKEQGLKSVIMDTGPAAIFGAATDLRYAEPCLIINFGNGHTVASIMSEGRITALFEHHTSQLSPTKLKHFVDMLCEGKIKNSEVFDDGGHGAFIEFMPENLKSKLVTGPRRDIFLKSRVLENAVAAAPAGDMMITGCVGLLEAWSRKEDLWR
jgi:uncharacterized protein (DUF1786 family)